MTSQQHCLLVFTPGLVKNEVQEAAGAQQGQLPLQLFGVWFIAYDQGWIQE